MPKKLYKKWDKALRSGKYEQGRGTLCTFDNKYCCLGVLQHCVDKTVERSRLTDEALGLPSAEWLKKYNVQFSYIRAYSELNDEENLGFIEIADVLKDNVVFTDE